MPAGGCQVFFYFRARARDRSNESIAPAFPVPPSTCPARRNEQEERAAAHPAILNRKFVGIGIGLVEVHKLK